MKRPVTKFHEATRGFLVTTYYLPHTAAILPQHCLTAVSTAIQTGYSYFF
jgi:hypothetical protein